MAAYINIPANSGSDPWFADQRALIQSLAPALTAYQDVKPGLQHMGDTLANVFTADGAQVGGAEATLAGAYRAYTTSIYQTPKTTSWGFSIQAIMPTPVAAKFNGIGLVNAAAGADISIASYQAIDATNYIINIDPGPTTVISTTPVVATVKTYTMAFDGTTIRALLNGVPIISTTNLTNVSDQPMAIGNFSTDAGAIKTLRIMYGYIAPG